MSKYVVKPGETIGDVVMNATGSLSNWDAILTANSFTEWVPDLTVGQSVVIPDSLPQDLNTKRQLANYPACNVSVNDVYSKIDVVLGTISNNWILETRYWNDSALWIDNKNWND